MLIDKLPTQEMAISAYNNNGQELISNDRLGFDKLRVVEIVEHIKVIK